MRDLRRRQDQTMSVATGQCARCGAVTGMVRLITYRNGGEVGTVRDTEVGESRATGSGEDGVCGPATRDIIGVPVQTHAASKARAIQPRVAARLRGKVECIRWRFGRQTVGETPGKQARLEAEDRGQAGQGG